MFRSKYRTMKVLMSMAFCALTPAFLSGTCLAAIGSLDSDAAVAESFKVYRFNPDYHYYVFMEGGIVYAVMGLQNDYRPQDPCRQPKKSNSDQFKGLVDRVANPPKPTDTGIFGAYVPWRKQIASCR